MPSLSFVSKKKLKKRKAAPPRGAGKSPRAPQLTADGESRPAIALTVAWMLTLLVTLVAELIALPCVIYVRLFPPQPGPALSAAHVADVFLFLSLVTGLICAGLVPLIYRVRISPPPQAITIAAIVAGTIPPITMVVRWLL